MPLKVLNKAKPFEKLNGKAPTYDMFEPFGCLCFASTLNKERSKFDPRADMCVFIGYAQSQKGYKLFNLKTKQVFVSRDVCFHKKFFPFHQNNNTDSTQQFFLPTNSEQISTENSTQEYQAQDTGEYLDYGNNNINQEQYLDDFQEENISNISTKIF